MSEPNTAMTASRERGAWSTSGYLMLVLFLVLLALIVWRVIAFAGGNVGAGPTEGEVFGFLTQTGLALFALLIVSSGFYMLQPNTAAAITLFGSYRGTDRHTGLRWVWPWMARPRSRSAPTT